MKALWFAFAVLIVATVIPSAVALNLVDPTPLLGETVTSLLSLVGLAFVVKLVANVLTVLMVAAAWYSIEALCYVILLFGRCQYIALRHRAGCLYLVSEDMVVSHLGVVCWQTPARYQELLNCSLSWFLDAYRLDTEPFVGSLAPDEEPVLRSGRVCRWMRGVLNLKLGVQNSGRVHYIFTRTPLVRDQIRAAWNQGMLGATL
jgi:hypothetical protein